MECPHRFDGSLFRGRYKAMVVEAERYLLELVRYIHRNPVLAGLVGRVDRYRWSSDHAYRSGSQQWAWLDNYGSVSSVVSRMKKTLTHDVRLRKRVDRVLRELRKAHNQT